MTSAVLRQGNCAALTILAFWRREGFGSEFGHAGGGRARAGPW